MKKLTKFIVLCIFSLFVFTLNVSAEENEAITVNVDTNKQEYSAEDQIEITIKIKNTSDNVGKNMIVNYVIPEGINDIISEGNNKDNVLTWKDSEFEKGEELTYTVKGKVTKALSSNEIKDSENVSVDTGDNTNFIHYWLLLGASLVCVIFVFRKNKKAGKVLLVLGIVSSSLTFTEVDAKDQYNEYEFTHNIKIGNEVIKGKVNISVLFEKNEIGDAPGSIKLSNEVNEYNVVTTDSGIVTLKGTAVDNNGIARIEYIAQSVTGIKQQGVATGKESWSFDLKAEDGTSDITVSCVDNLNNKTSISFKVNSLTNSIELNDNVLIADERILNNLNNELIDVINNPDTKEMDLIFKNNSQFLDSINKQENGLGLDKVLMIEPDDVFVTGLTKKIAETGSCETLSIPSEHLYPDGIAAYDSSYSYVHLVEPSYAELYQSEVALDFSEMYIDDENPIAFIAYADGAAVPGNQVNTNVMKYARSNKKGFQTDSLKKIFDLKTEAYSNGKGIKKIGFDFDNVVIYDADGNLDSTDDQLSISGESGLDNLKTGGGLEWHPTLFDPFPQQLKYELKFDQINNISTTVGMSFDSKDFVKNANKSLQFTNETKGILGIIDIAGVKLTDRIYLGTVGVNVFTGVIEYGTLGSISKIDKSIMIPLNFFIETSIDGNINFTIEAGYNSYNRLGFNVQKENFNGSYGSVDDNRSDSIHQEVGNYVLDVYNESSKSKGSKEKPEAYLKGELDGNINARIGAGMDSGIMILGIMPLTAGVSISTTMNAAGKLVGTIYSNSEPEVDIAGVADVKGTLDAMYDARLVIENFELFSNRGRITLWTIFDKHFEVYKGVKGSTYTSDSEDKKIQLADVKIKFANKETGEIFESVSDSEGSYVNDNVKAGTYTITAYKDGYALYTSEISIGTINSEQYDICLVPLDNANATGYVYANVPENRFYPEEYVPNATVNIYENNNLIKTVQSNADGFYSVGDLPFGKYEVEAVKAGYKTIRTSFEYLENDCYYSVPLEKLPDLTVKKGETYRFTGIGGSPKIYIVQHNVKLNIADYTDNLHNAIINASRETGYIPIRKNKNFDITVVDGDFDVYFTNSGSKEEISATKLDHDAIKVYTLKSGEEMTITADFSLGVWGYRPITHKSIDATAILTKNATSVVPTEVIIEPGTVGDTLVWGLRDTSTVHYKVNSGTLYIGIRYDDLKSVHIQ